MPFKSDAQRRAMYAAASGHSTLGIPRRVALEFIRKSHHERPRSRRLRRVKRRMTGED